MSLQDNGFPCPTMLKTTIVHVINIKELIDNIFKIENMQSAFLNVTSAYSHHYPPQINMSLAPLPNINSNEAAMTTFKLVEIEIDCRREITPILVKYSKHNNIAVMLDKTEKINSRCPRIISSIEKINRKKIKEENIKSMKKMVAEAIGDKCSFANLDNFIESRITKIEIYNHNDPMELD